MQFTGVQEIGDLFGVSRTRVQQLTARSDLPAPPAELDQGRVWDGAVITGGKGRGSLKEAREP